jgi:hypothetical protein
MKEEGTTGGFEQASADAERLAKELAEIRKQLTELREQNAAFLASDPLEGNAKAPAPSKGAAANSPVPAGQASPGDPAKAGTGTPSKKPVAVAATERAKEPQMAGTRAASSAGHTPAETPKSGKDEATGDVTVPEADEGKKKWWRRHKSEDPKGSGF